MSLIISVNGRSGTSNLFDFLYRVLEQDGVHPYGIYEPFYWGKPTWGKSYEELGPFLSTIDNSSPAGILANKTIPLYVESLEGLENTFCYRHFKQLIGDYPNFLAKFIRASSRGLFLEAIAPDVQIIFIVRNPIRVVSSLAKTFSHFGEGLYASDFHRFDKQSVAIFGEEYLNYRESLRMFGIVGAQVLYWHFTNRFNYEQVGSGLLKNTSIYIHEELCSESIESLRNLVGRIGVDWRANYDSIFSRHTGHSSGQSELPSGLLSAIKPSIDLFNEIAMHFRVSERFDPFKICRNSTLGVKDGPVFISSRNESGASLIKKNIILEQRLKRAFSTTQRQKQRYATRLKQLDCKISRLESDLNKNAAEVLILQRRKENLISRNEQLSSALQTMREELICSQRAISHKDKRIIELERRLKKFRDIKFYLVGSKFRLFFFRIIFGERLLKRILNL